MRIEIQSGNVRITKKLMMFLRKRIEFALGRFQDRIQTVQVRLSDINGPKGGVDKRCQIQLSLPAQKDVVVTTKAHRLDVAIAKTAARSAQALSRALGKRRSRRKAERYLPNDDDLVAT